MDIIRIGSVELTPEEAAAAHERGLYIVAFRRVYQVNYSADPLTRRGRFFRITGEAVNHLIGHELLN